MLEHLFTVDKHKQLNLKEKVMMKSLRLATSGLRVAYQVWGQGNPVKVLCLHGWLDNSNSFYVLAPFLAHKGRFEVVAVDHIGHGLSDHLPHQNVFARYVGNSTSTDCTVKNL
jgi:pimeloyl-ACP methyl ester carboxylesterase